MHVQKYMGYGLAYTCCSARRNPWREAGRGGTKRPQNRERVWSAGCEKVQGRREHSPPPPAQAFKSAESEHARRIASQGPLRDAESSQAYCIAGEHTVQAGDRGVRPIVAPAPCSKTKRDHHGRQVYHRLHACAQGEGESGPSMQGGGQHAPGSVYA